MGNQAMDDDTNATVLSNHPFVDVRGGSSILRPRRRECRRSGRSEGAT